VDCFDAAYRRGRCQVRCLCFVGTVRTPALDERLLGSLGHQRWIEVVAPDSGSLPHLRDRDPAAVWPGETMMQEMADAEDGVVAT
jgi:hypothetical protein